MTKPTTKISLSVLATALSLAIATPALAASFQSNGVENWEKTSDNRIKVEDRWGKFYSVGIEAGCAIIDGEHELKFRADSGSKITGFKRDRIRSGKESCRITSVKKIKG